jgi:hypothetical protein
VRDAWTWIEGATENSNKRSNRTEPVRSVSRHVRVAMPPLGSIGNTHELHARYFDPWMSVKIRYSGSGYAKG